MNCSSCKSGLWYPAEKVEGLCNSCKERVIAQAMTAARATKAKSSDANPARCAACAAVFPPGGIMHEEGGFRWCNNCVPRRGSALRPRPCAACGDNIPLGTAFARINGEDYCANCDSKALADSMNGEGSTPTAQSMIFRKDDEDKSPMGRLPLEQLSQVADVLAHGAKKYDWDNWKKGTKYTRILSSTLRHLTAFQNKEEVDDESKESHLAHAVCNLLFLMWYEDNEAGEDDR